MKLPYLSRRRLLSVLAITSLLPSLSVTDAIARFPRGNYSGSSFNGGKSQVNPNFNLIGGDYPFVDYLLDAQAWGARDNAYPVRPDQLSSTGWPLPNTDVMNNHLGTVCVFFIPSLVNGGVIYSLPVTGKGTIETFGSIVTIAITSITGGATTATINFGTTHYFEVGMECPIASVSGTIAATLNGNKYVVASISTNSITITVGSSTTGLSGTGGTASYGDFNVGVATNGQVIVDLTGAVTPGGPGPSTGNAISISVAIRATDLTTPITKVSYVAIMERTRWRFDPLAFGSKFLAKMQEWKPGVIRFLNKMATNSSNVAVWADRKPQTYFSFNAYQAPSSIWAGTSTSTLNAYSMTLGSGGPTDKQHISAYYDAAAVTCSVSASAAVITFPGAHNLVVGDVFNLFYEFGGSAPVNLSTGLALAIIGQGKASGNSCATNFYVLSTPTSSTLTFSFTKGGTAVTTSSAGSLLRAHSALAFGDFTSLNGSATLTCTNHDFKVGMLISPLAFQNGELYPTGVIPYAKTYFVKTAAANTITISATSGGAAIVMDQTLTITFAEQPTLSLNGTTAYPIKDRGGISMSYGGNTIAQAYVLNNSLQFTTLTFDSELQCFMNAGSTAGYLAAGIDNGWPPEVCMKLCMEIGAHPYFTAPPYTMDAPTDYFPSLAAYCKSYAATNASWMIPRFEGINENWNTLFFGTLWSKCKAYAHSGWSTNTLEDEYGLQTSTLGQSINTAYGGAVGSGYKLIMGVQTAGLAGSASGNAERMNASQYVANGPTFSGYTKTAASNWVTTGVCAQYFSPATKDTAQETTWANAVAAFTASINTSGVMNVTATSAGTIAVGMMVAGGSVPWQSVITSNLGGGNWQLSVSPTAAVASTQMYGAAATDVKAYADGCAGNRWTGSIAAGVLTVTALSDSWTSVNQGESIVATGLADNSFVGSQIGGTPNGIGTYNITSSTTTLTSRSMSSANFCPPQLAVLYRNFWTFLQTYTNNAGNKPTMEGYEGGYSPDMAAQGTTRLDQFRGFSKLITNTTLKTNGIQDYYTDNVDGFVAANGTFWSEFQFSGASSVVDIWSVLDDIYMTPAGPQELAIALRN